MEFLICLFALGALFLLFRHETVPGVRILTIATIFLILLAVMVSFNAFLPPGNY